MRAGPDVFDEMDGGPIEPFPTGGYRDPLSVEELFKAYAKTSANDPNGRCIALALIALVARLEHLIVGAQRNV